MQPVRSEGFLEPLQPLQSIWRSWQSVRRRGQPDQPPDLWSRAGVPLQGKDRVVQVGGGRGSEGIFQLRIDEVHAFPRAGVPYEGSGKEVAVADECPQVDVHPVRRREVELSAYVA